MILDKRTDTFDELQMLAADVRTRRRRANLWTTGLVAGSMAVTGAYFSATNEQVDQLRESRNELQRQVISLTEERNALRLQQDFSRRQQELLNDNSSSVEDTAASNPIFVYNFPEGEAGRADRDAPGLTLANLVWWVDGSRRFPVKDNDILWIPEGGFWIRKERGGNGDHLLTYHDVAPSGPAAAGVPMTLPFRREVSRGSLNCLEINLHPQSNRDGFSNNPDYVDVEVIYSANANCLAAQ